MCLDELVLLLESAFRGEEGGLAAAFGLLHIFEGLVELVYALDGHWGRVAMSLHKLSQRLRSVHGLPVVHAFVV